MKLSEFDYHLPKEQIAQYPAAERDSSRLLVINRKNRKIKHRLFRDIIEYLHPGDVLVLNDAKVIPARLYGKKPSGGKVEVLLIKKSLPNKWQAIVKGLQRGQVVFNHEISGYVARINGTATVTFNGDDIKRVLNEMGVMPLPPYIKRPAEQLDTQRYQTVYARIEGAVAAPTAGLHFTSELLDKIKSRGVEVRKLTLHVGYGTFKPVVTSDITRHHMDEESYEIPETTANSINLAKSEGRRVVAVGTTVTRALEASATGGTENMMVNPVRKNPPPGLSNRVKSGTGKASIFIYPGYRFKIIDTFITNFHLPKSTPMMLTSAFSELQLLKNAYLEASSKGYRFFSYGDAMLII